MEMSLISMQISYLKRQLTHWDLFVLPSGCSFSSCLLGMAPSSRCWLRLMPGLLSAGEVGGAGQPLARQNVSISMPKPFSSPNKIQAIKHQ